MRLQIPSHLGILAGFVSAFEHYQDFVGGEITLVQRSLAYVDTPESPRLNELLRSQQKFQEQLEVSRAVNNELRSARLLLGSKEANQRLHVLSFHTGPAKREFEACPLEERLLVPDDTPLERQLQIGRFLAAISYAWVVDGHMRGEGMPAIQVQRICAGEPR